MIYFLLWFIPFIAPYIIVYIGLEKGSDIQDYVYALLLDDKDPMIIIISFIPIANWIMTIIMSFVVFYEKYKYHIIK